MLSHACPDVHTTRKSERFDMAILESGIKELYGMIRPDGDMHRGWRAVNIKFAVRINIPENRHTESARDIWASYLEDIADGVQRG